MKTPAIADTWPQIAIVLACATGLFGAELPRFGVATLKQAAIQEQLGLKREARKGPLDVLVVDQADKVPAEN